jgi:hypothetical protein
VQLQIKPEAAENFRQGGDRRLTARAFNRIHNGTGYAGTAGEFAL